MEGVKRLLFSKNQKFYPLKLLNWKRRISKTKRTKAKESDSEIISRETLQSISIFFKTNEYEPHGL